MNGPEIEFDWDEANTSHVARHSVLPEEAEQVILNDPVDLGIETSKGRSAISTSAQQRKAAFFSW
jgi:hypothetical protein